MRWRGWRGVRVLLFLLLLPSAAAQVAVLDTGVDSGHTEFAGVRVEREVFVTYTPLPLPDTVRDPDGHGTAAASLVGGVTLGHADVDLWDLQVWSRTGTVLDPASEQAAAAALDWALRNHGGADAAGPRVLLLGFAQAGISEAGAQTLAAQARALFDAGVAVVVPAASSPSALHKSPYVLTVGCTDSCPNGTSGPDAAPKPDVVADGSSLTAARALAGGTVQVTGSAFAAAEAAATVARIWQAYPDIPVDAVFAIVRATAAPGDAGPVLDAGAAVAAAGQWEDPAARPSQDAPLPVLVTLVAVAAVAWRRR